MSREKLDAAVGSWWRMATLVGVALAGLSFASVRERASVEHGNRLHRDLEMPRAAGVYRGASDDQAPRPNLRYNLGTTLLGIGSSGAEEQLLIGTESEDEEVRRLALYNVGLSRLLRATAAQSGDSIRVHAGVSVEANKSSLRLSPDQPDAKWNLAMAQRMLDSLDAADRRSGRATAEGPVDADDLAQSENAIEGEDEDQRPGEAPLDGEDETEAEAADEGPLSLAEALEILEATGLDGREIMSKLLALESRARWGRQINRIGPRR
mgnify:CR=1 FL=1|jgi:hypothetical protein